MTFSSPANHNYPQSFIHPDARIHESVKIGPFCSISADVEIGEGCEIDSHVVIYDGVSIGKNCKIMPNTVISADASKIEYWRENREPQIARVQIGDHVHMQPGVNIHGGVVIGDHCWLGSSSIIHDGARIGKHVKIFSGAVISAIPQDLKFKGEKTTLEIGDYSTIRECATLNRGTEFHGKTEIGKHVLIMAYAHIAHDCIIGDHVIVVNAVNMAGHVEIGDWAIIGGMTGIHQFVKIGKHAMIAGHSVVTKDVPTFVKAGRSPLQYVGVNSIGLRRRGFSNETINYIQEIYRKIFVSGMNTGQALDYVETQMLSSEERDEILTFIRKATRGIIKGHA
ncbi:MAG: acyl-ACP--UDP-N-acetylglucosamine O-acyltransferase [Bacteroidota bacterium]